MTSEYVIGQVMNQFAQMMQSLMPIHPLQSVLLVIFSLWFRFFFYNKSFPIQLPRFLSLSTGYFQ